MDTQEENLPELFRIDYYSRFFIGELIHSDLYKTRSFTGFIQIFDGQVICNAPSKKSLIDCAEEICIMKLTHGMHIFEGRNVEILKTPYNLN